MVSRLSSTGPRGGGERHVLVWGAINALAHPTDASSTQQAFQVDYSGGWKSRHDRGLLAHVQKRLRALRRAAAAAAGRRVQGPRWVLLGAAGMAAQAADARLPALDGRAEGTRGARVPLERCTAAAGGLSPLDLRPHQAGLLRAADLRGRAGVRHEVAVGDGSAIAGRATSTSTPSTPTTARDGATTPPSPRTAAAAASVTRSSRSRRPRATRAPSRTGPAWARSTASPSWAPA